MLKYRLLIVYLKVFVEKYHLTFILQLTNLHEALDKQMKDVHQHVKHEHLNRFENIQDVVYETSG